MRWWTLTLEVLAPLTVKRDGKLIALSPGDRLDWPEAQAEKLLARASGKVRLIAGDWEAAWDELAQATDGIEKTDPRFMPVMAALEHCDAAFEQDNWGLFREVAKEVQRLMNGGKER